MKKLFFIVILFVCFSSQAQNWEGIITWKITTEMDAATKAKMDEAQQKLNDPATREQLLEMKKKMDDPQFKQMLEANPQMKAQIDQMLNALEGGNVNSLMPSGFVVKVKDQNSLAKMEGGMLGNMEVLYLRNQNKTYQIDRDGKTYTELKSTATEDVKVENVKITKTNETKTILNYPCTKYIAESTIEGQRFQQIFWTTTAIKGLDMKSLASQKLGQGTQKMFYEKIDGVPLRMEIKQAQLAMTMEATELKKTSLPASDFELPTGFKAQ